MTTKDELPQEIKWRESKYMLTGINDDGDVEWLNPYSKFRGVCSVESWKAAQPYGSKFETR